MSIIGHLYHLALATPTMTDEIGDVEEAIEGRLLQVVGKTGNATKAFMPQGQKSYDELTDDLERHLNTGFPRIYKTIGKDERGNNVPFAVVLSDITMVMLFPPPSAVVAPANVHILDPNRPRP